jgi:chromosome partitioning protein
LTNVVVLASRKGGSGKSTLTAHLGAHAFRSSGSCLLIDADPQGSLALWQSLRRCGEPPLKAAVSGIADLVRQAEQSGTAWIFIDTPPNMSPVVVEAIRCATIVVIPARPGVFDIDAVKETIEFTRALHKPYAVVINSAPVRRANRDANVVVQARQHLAGINAPVWGGQISYRTNYSLALAEGEDADEYDSASLAAIEIGTLWYAVEQSVRAITEMRGGAAGARARPNAA